MKFSVTLYSGLITKLVLSLYESSKTLLIFSIETINVQKYLIIQELFHPGLENKGIKIDTSTDPIAWIRSASKLFLFETIAMTLRPQ